MDSWRLDSLCNKSLLASDESIPLFCKDQIGSMVMGWEVKPSFIFANNNMGLIQNEFNIETQGFGDMVYPQLCKTSEKNESNDGLFDLKLGRLIDHHNLSSSEVCMPSKRPRERSFGSSTSFCKVHGCNEDLSNCKEYNKRHKVCEVHTKTSKVIVNGIEQRFCQQCSR